MRRTFQRAQMLAAGRKALAAIDAGAKPADLLLSFPYSRATFYRALALAHETDNGQVALDEYNARKFVDPLLE